MTMNFRDQMRKGSTEILVMSLLTEGPMYGYEISQQLEQRSDGYFELKEGLLYPALHRMQQKGWLSSEWQTVEGRPRKYYTLTALGSKILREQATEWLSFLDAIHAMLKSDHLWTK
jgi:PadR family transcriptional regulator, regulatory protein PadR